MANTPRIAERESVSSGEVRSDALGPPRENAAAIYRWFGWWFASIVLAILALFAARGTTFQQPVIGILATAISLFVLLTVFEALWLLLAPRPGPGKTSSP